MSYIFGVKARTKMTMSTENGNSVVACWVQTKGRDMYVNYTMYN